MYVVIYVCMYNVCIMFICIYECMHVNLFVYLILLKN